MEVLTAEGLLQRARVEAKGEEQEYAPEEARELSLWLTRVDHDQLFEEGFDTSLHAASERKVFPRSQIYESPVLRQTLSATARAAAERRAAAEGSGGGLPAPSSSEWLLLQYADAERTLPQLHALADRVIDAVRGGLGGSEATPTVRAIFGSLKGLPRATFKTLQHYDQPNGEPDWPRLTDLARMTFECSSLRAADAVLEALAADAEFQVVLLKDRLMRAFNANPTGGYRDMVLKLRCKSTEHIAEVQITLVRLLSVKQSGGHAAYAVSRLLELNEIEIYRHEGALSDHVLADVRAGVVRELICNGKGAQVGEKQHCDKLLAAVRERTCALTEVYFEQVDWPDGRPMSELLAALGAGGARLEVLRLTGTYMGGELPPDIFEPLEWLQSLQLARPTS